ncbi:unnamed protein product [Caretta caretta]
MREQQQSIHRSGDTTQSQTNLIAPTYRTKFCIHVQFLFDLKDWWSLSPELDYKKKWLHKALAIKTWMLKRKLVQSSVYSSALDRVSV